MEDNEIVELFWQRSNTAINETELKYSKYCFRVAYGILRSKEDADECVSDTLLRAWNAMPPARPAVLRTFLGKITRNLSLNALEKMNAEKRGLGQAALALTELEDCIPGNMPDGVQTIEEEALTEAIDKFLGGLRPDLRKVFVRRYWYMSELSEIARDYKMSVSKVKSILFRLRRKLKAELEKEGILL